MVLCGLGQEDQVAEGKAVVTRARSEAVAGWRRRSGGASGGRLVVIPALSLPLRGFSDRRRSPDLRGGGAGSQGGAGGWRGLDPANGDKRTPPSGSESPESAPGRTLLRPLARSVLRLNRLDGGRLKSEKEPREMVEGGEGGGEEGSSPTGSGVDSLSILRTSTVPSGAGCPEEGGGAVVASRRRLWWSFRRGGAGRAAGGGGAAESGGQGTTTAGRRPASCTAFPLPSGLRWTKPSNVCVLGAASACVFAASSRDGGGGLDSELGNRGGPRSEGRAFMWDKNRGHGAGR